MENLIPSNLTRLVKSYFNEIIDLLSLLFLWFSNDFVRQYAGREIVVVGVNGILGVNSDTIIEKEPTDQLHPDSRIPPAIKWTVIKIEADTFALQYSGQFNYFLSIGGAGVLLQEHLQGDEIFTLARDHDKYGIRTSGPGKYLSIGAAEGIIPRPSLDVFEKFELFVVT